MSKTVNVDIDEKGDISVDIIGGAGPDCHSITAAFAKLGKVTKDVKKPEYYQQPNKNTISQGR